MEPALPRGNWPTERTATGRSGTDAPLHETASDRPTRLCDLFRGPHFTLLGQRSAPSLGDVGTGIVRPCPVGPGGLLDDAGHVAHAYVTDALVLVRPH